MQILKSGDFDRLKGLVEDEYLDFKSEFYHLSDEKNKFEFAKDVSSFANSMGGILVLGVETEKVAEHPNEVATKIKLIKRSSFNKDKYLQLISSWIYPDLHVEVDFLPSLQDNDKGLIYIYIDAKVTTLKPFLVKKALFDNSLKSNGTAYAFFQRKGSMNQPYSVEEMQRFFKDGMRFDDHLSDIHFILSQNLAGPSEKSLSINDDMKSRFNCSIVSCNFKGVSTYSLGFLPVPFSDMTSMFQGKSSEVYKLIQSPPKLRDHGFDLDTGSNYSPKIVDGNILRSCASQYKSLDVWRDGGIVFSAENQEFLCWASESKKYTRVNSVALVESIYLFVLFVNEIYKKVKAKVKNYYFSIYLNNPLGTNLGLFGGPLIRVPPPHSDVKVYSEKEIFILKSLILLILIK